MQQRVARTAQSLGVAMHHTMSFSRLAAVAILTLFASACATASRFSGTELCSELTSYANASRKGQGSFVQLGRQGTWLVDHSKTCAHEDDDQAGTVFCNWLMEHTSTEFMEATVNLVMACLQGQRIHGHLGNTGVSQWEGKADFYSPRIESEGIRIEISWRLMAGSGEWDDFLKIAVSPE